MKLDDLVRLADAECYRELIRAAYALGVGEGLAQPVATARREGYREGVEAAVRAIWDAIPADMKQESRSFMEGFIGAAATNALSPPADAHAGTPHVDLPKQEQPFRDAHAGTDEGGTGGRT